MRLGQQSSALVFGAFEHAAFPGRPAGHDHRPLPSGERPGDIGIGHRVEPQLDQIGVA